MRRGKEKEENKEIKVEEDKEKGEGREGEK